MSIEVINHWDNDWKETAPTPVRRLSETEEISSIIIQKVVKGFLQRRRFEKLQQKKLEDEGFITVGKKNLKKETEEPLSEEKKVKMSKYKKSQLCKYRFKKNGIMTCAHIEKGRECFFALNESELVNSKDVIECQWGDECRFNKRRTCKFSHTKKIVKKRTSSPVKRKSSYTRRISPVKRSSISSSNFKTDFSSIVMKNIERKIKKEEKKEPVIRLEGFDVYASSQIVSILNKNGFKNFKITMEN